MEKRISELSEMRENSSRSSSMNSGELVQVFGKIVNQLSRCILFSWATLADLTAFSSLQFMR